MVDSGAGDDGPAVEVITVTVLCSRYLRFAKDYYLKDGKCSGVTPSIKSAIGDKFLADALFEHPRDSGDVVVGVAPTEVVFDYTSGARRP